jgi:hypothetical protein
MRYMVETWRSYLPSDPKNENVVATYVVGLLALLLGAIFAGLSNATVMTFLTENRDPFGILPLWYWFYIFGACYLVYALLKVPALLFQISLLNSFAQLVLSFVYGLVGVLVFAATLRWVEGQFGGVISFIAVVLGYILWYRWAHPDEWNRINNAISKRAKKEWNWFQEMRRLGY